MTCLNLSIRDLPDRLPHQKEIKPLLLLFPLSLASANILSNSILSSPFAS